MNFIQIIGICVLLFLVIFITKKKVWKQTLIFLVYWIWCFPQTFVGFIWYIICKIRGFKTYRYKNAFWTTSIDYSPAGGVSLGMFIFGKDYDSCRLKYDVKTEDVKKHEYGHALQSLILGWLYFIVIALPSVIWLSHYEKTDKDYYWFYTEAWAEKLGKVNRKKYKK